MSRTTDTALTRWPLVVLDVSALDPAAGARRVGDVLTAALERREPFAAVLTMPESRPRKLAGAGERVRLVKTLRPGLRNRCAGLAFVVSAEAQQANAKAIRAGAKLWGCPTTATHDPAAALAWARQQLAAPTPGAEEER
ncbi:hypothetical protein ACFFS2_21480 [Streptomyces aurantiacus]|uniref:Uncharacterized protein n=1 Tax=Streptomyces aurantiacus TaxID=47760 RepID=A0A7G1P9W9_9ACTN|nr:hypothetical protein [Streptomyces aurantiacus]BCL30714.1 hypothetical protein GCM10017557_55730 [Streptomyces aurantiacus]